MSDVDPILLAWKIVSETERPDRLSTAQVAAAALNGTTALTPEQRDVLLLRRSEEYETLLARMWSRHGLPHDLIAEATQWPATGALGAALREHVRDCESPSCRAVAEAWAREERPVVREVPDPDAQARVALARFGATLLQVLRPPRIVVANDREPGNETQLEKEAAGRFGRGIRLLADPDDPQRARVVVDFDRMPELQGRDVVVVVLRDDDEPLAYLTFLAAAGRQRQSLQVDSALIWQRRLHVVVGLKKETG